MLLGVLRVLTQQTLEINSVVKDPTYLDPSLVTEVEDSSLTILHQIYSAAEGFYTSHKYRKREGAPLRVSSKEGAFVELEQFRFGQGEEFLENLVTRLSL
jgi:hypothetical protein